MARCAYCNAEFPDDKFGFRMEIREGNSKKVALFCRECGSKMRAELKKKMLEVKDKGKEKI